MHHLPFLILLLIFTVILILMLMLMLLPCYSLHFKMAEANPSRDRERNREGYGNGNGILGGGVLSSSSSGQNDYNNRHGEGYSQSIAQPQLTRIMSGRSSGKEIERELMSPSKYHDDFEDEEDEDNNEIPEEDEEDVEEEEEKDRVIEAVTRRKR